MVRRAEPGVAIAALVVGFLALALIVTMTFRLNQRAQSIFEDVSAARSLRVASEELRSALQTAESSQRGYLYTGNEIYLAPYDVAKTQARRQIENVKTGLASYLGLQPAGRQLSNVVDQKVVEMDQSIQLKQQRRDADALAMVQTNHGKALTDEANIYLSGIVRATDQRLLAGVQEEQSNASMVRLISIVGALAIVVMVAIASYLIWNYTRNLNAAKDELTQFNAGLEKRVADRTRELNQANEGLRAARDRAEVLLGEVNHRVANSLTMVSTLVKLQANSLADRVAKEALAETQTRIYAVSLVHRKLYTSGDVKAVWLDEYLSGMLEHLQATVDAEHRGISITSDIARLSLPADQTTNLGVILNEWVSNAIKYAYPSGKGEIRVVLAAKPGRTAELSVTDEGIGMPAKGKPSGTGFGTKIVRAMAASLAGEVEYATGDPGTIARLTFPLKQAEHDPPAQGKASDAVA